MASYSLSSTCAQFSRSDRRRFVSVALACALGVLQACSDSAATAPSGPTIAETPSAPVPAIRPSQSARISRVLPDTVQMGSTLVLEGEYLPTDIGSVRLTVAGVALDVRAASANRLEAVLPAGSLPCAAPAAVMLRLDGATPVELPVVVRTAVRLSLAAGAPAMMLSPVEAQCVELPGSAAGQGARYVVTVVNTDADPTAQARVDLRGMGTGVLARAANIVSADMGSLPLSAAAMPMALAARATPSAPSTVLGGATEDRDVAAVETARRLLDGTLPRFSRAAALKTPVGVGDTVTVRALLSSCAAGQSIRARVVYAGTKAVVLEDVGSTRAGTMDAAYRAIGQEFDRVVYPLLAAQIGDPLAMNGAMSGDGRVTMLFTRFVNDSVAGTTGYVSACNFYPRARFAASNEDEMLYVRTPTAAESVDDWRRSVRSTVVHEAKHLASFAERLSRGNPGEEVWLEEATARMAEELYARTFSGGGSWKGNTGFAGALSCEITACDDRPLVMWKHFSQLYAYLRATDSLTPFGPRSATDATFYASGWSLVRWAVDQYASSEPAMLKALVSGGSRTGVAHLAQLAGVPTQTLLAGWATANATGATGASWNVADVWGGLSMMFPGLFQATPLRGRAVASGNFVLGGLQLPAASATYLTVSGVQGGAQMLALDEGGSGSLRVTVRRVE